MKVARGVILGVLLAAYSVAGVGNAVAQNLCPYDTTGDYTYDPAASPTYLFFGDGQITYDGSLPWYMDDTLACYNVYKTPGYLPYFPKCDLDDDGQVAISEVYDIYYRVHPVAQGDAIAQAACVEAFAGGPFYFCPPSRYNRTVSDIQTIIDAYPAAEAIVASGSSSLGHVPEGYYTFNRISCENPVGFPPGAFDQINACYQAEESPVLGAYIFYIDFANSLDVTNAVSEYSDVAQNYGGVCMPLSSGSLPGTTPGFHYSKYGDQGWWLWNVRATEKCVQNTCRCDVRYELWTHKDYPGEVWLNAETVNNDDCTDLRFLDCDTTLDADGNGYPDCLGPCYPDGDMDGDGLCDMVDPCPSDPDPTMCFGQCYEYGGDSDGDHVCDDVDQCPGENDLLDTDGDGTPDCLEICPNGDPNKIGPGVCGCYEPDIDEDGDGVYTCEGDLCDNDPNKTEPGECGCGEGDYDSNGNGIADCLEECIHGDPSKIEPGVCGCHEPDIDDDGDGVYTCQGDLCDNDPNKTEPGECGCGQAEGTCPTCDDLGGTDWGSCASPQPLGAAIIYGSCEMIFGCAIPAGVSLYPTLSVCETTCSCCASHDDCGLYEHCMFEMGDCGSGGCGTCVDNSALYCVNVEEPVCGCDGQTYTNECFSMLYGISLEHEGACIP